MVWRKEGKNQSWVVEEKLSLYFQFDTNGLSMEAVSKSKILFLLQMRHSRRTNYPDWDEKESWDRRRCDSGHKRKRRSFSGTQENKHFKHDLSKLTDR